MGLFVAIAPWHTKIQARDIKLKERYTAAETVEERVRIFCEQNPSECKRGRPRVRLPGAVRPILGGRGMVGFHDRLDWLGGLPFEGVLPRDVFRFVEGQGHFVEERSAVYGVKNAPTNDYYVFRRV